MGKIAVVVGFALALTASTARAGYVMSIAGPGTMPGEKLEVKPGDKFKLDVILTNDGAKENEHATSTWNLNFTFPKAGLYLEYQGYTWSDPFTTGGPDDRSVPRGGDLPFDIIGPDGKIYFDNIVDDATPLVKFGVGTLVTLNFGVPEGVFDANMPASIQIIPKPIFLGYMFVPVQTTGEKFTLNVVPEPATLALLGFAGLVALRRRRS